MFRFNDSFDIDKQLYSLIGSEAFFSEISQGLNKFQTEKVQTAGVFYDKEKEEFYLAWNPRYFNDELKNDIERKAIIKHELLHIGLLHVTDRLPEEARNNNELFEKFGHAADLSINCRKPLKDELPKSCLFPGQGLYEGLKNDLTMEEYFDKIKKMKTIPINWDDHSQWRDASSIAKKWTKDLVQRAIKKASVKGWGTLSNNLQKEAIYYAFREDVDWVGILNQFIHQSIRSYRRSSPKKLNKKFPNLVPGIKTKRAAHLLMAIDESGSMEKDFLKTIFGNLAAFSNFATFSYVPFDAECKKEDIKVWKRGQKLPIFRTKNGGTNFDAPTKLFNDCKEYDGLIILTDLQAPKPEPCRSRRLWITNEENYAFCQMKGEFGDEQIVSIHSSDR